MAAVSTLVSQAAAIPLLRGRVCLITSRSGRRWVIPKGCLEPGKSAAQIALQEAWEEAGLVGVLAPEPVGTYLYEKSAATCHVTVYTMRVTETADDWPERSLRERQWLTVRAALTRIDEAALRGVDRGSDGCRLEALKKGVRHHCAKHPSGRFGNGA